MALGQQKVLIWRMCAALLAFAILFGAPASHAARQLCSAEQTVSIDHDHKGDDHPRQKAALGDQACSSSICAVCILAFPSPVNDSSDVGSGPGRIANLHDHLTGKEPSPDFKPPRTIG
ncbi:hypothetical protein [Rhizobium sp. LC145]|uniref:hypothetical protein n=1 Tax=Rhizobium sp. LC145 TaxID=1120688 RepID=UPI0010C9B205|nr:hypothetical protein [Rhizobium sp. LC145]MDX3927974.1 hypothetical protein [Shinella sp.]TKT66190.1 hypothetical protein FDR95_06845 [Rhizobiaceae bacterium LC148]